MDTNACDENQLESQVLLPPRKRFLAGLKKQNSNSNGSPSPPPLCASSSSTSNGSSGSTNVQTHLDNLLTSHLNDPNLTPEEIAESSRLAAAAAANAAKAARSVADKKAFIAAQAISAAKNALELFYSFPEEAESVKERSPKKNKQKKHIPVELLYSNRKELLKEKSAAGDEDLGRRLFRAINSSSRVMRTCSSSEGKGPNNKKLKTTVTSENPRTEAGSSIASRSVFDEHDIAGIIDSDGSNDGVDKTRVSDTDTIKVDLTDLKNKTAEENNSLGKKRGRVKLKKLPLSICSSRDQENHKEDGQTKSFPAPLPEKTVANHRNKGKKSLGQPEGSNNTMIPVISGQSWKCQDLKAPECSKQNKAVRS